MKLTPLVLLLLCACRAVAGTDELFLCNQDCPGEGGGSAGGGGAGGAAACGDGQLAVEITIVGPVVVEIDSTGEELTAGTSERCLDAGNERLRAACTDESNAPVAWGNDLCSDGEDTCDFTLGEDEVFVVDGASVCD